MNSKQLQKLGGYLLILGSILLIIYTIATSILITKTANFTQMVLNNNWLWITTTSFISILLMIFGFFAVYTKIYNKSGLMGLIGFVSIVIAYILQACKVTWEIFIFPILAKNEKTIFLLQDNIIKHSHYVVCFKTIASLTILIAIICFSIAIFRSTFFSKTSAILILMGALIYGISPLLTQLIGIIGIFILSVGCFLLGQKLIQE